MDEMNYVSLSLLQEWILERRAVKLRELFDEYHVVDMAALVNELTVHEILVLFKILRKDVTGEVFTYLEQDKKEELIQAFSGPEIREILENLYADDIVDFMEEMPANLTKKVLASATEQTRTEINWLLSFPEDSAGSIMSTDFVELKVTDTV